MSWTTYHHRKEALRDVLAIADRRRQESTATELFAEVESVKTVFATEADLLLDVQMFWHQALSGQLDRTLSAGAKDMEAFTVHAWTAVAERLPGARVLLDANRDMPEMQVAFAKELELVARSAGLPANHPELLGHGRRIIEAARENVVDVPFVELVHATGFMSRFREAFAA
ncbi:MAG: hypothetical protein ABIR57_03050 [Aeromicrobium sp.]